MRRSKFDSNGSYWGSVPFEDDPVAQWVIEWWDYEADGPLPFFLIAELVGTSTRSAINAYERGRDKLRRRLRHYELSDFLGDA